jgi:hypothetical protein
MQPEVRPRLSTTWKFCSRRLLNFARERDAKRVKMYNSLSFAVLLSVCLATFVWNISEERNHVETNQHLSHFAPVPLKIFISCSHQCNAVSVLWLQFYVVDAV